MRRILLATTMLVAAVSSGFAQTSIETATITPGGSITDGQGHVWEITASGSITEDGQYTPGGGGTSALMIGKDGTIYGQDNGHGPVNPGGWFTLSTDGQSWAPQSAPPAEAATAPAASDAPVVAAASIAAAAAPPTSCGGAPASGRFKVTNGEIIGPDGKSFIARGVNVYDDLAVGDFDAIVAMFPGINFIRIGMHSYSAAGNWDGLAQKAAARGTVLEFENHPDAGGGQDSGPPGGIPAESAWYASMASHFANNPYVWFGTFNEPKGIPALSQWQAATYQAVRGAGNTNPVIVYSTGEQGVLQPGVYASMTNIIWDVHFYGGGGSTNTDPMLAASIATSQSIQSADGKVPAIIGEYGDSMDGTNVDSNGVAAVTSVVNLGSSGKTGSAAWAYNPGGNADRLQNGGQLTSPYGEMVALYINTSVRPCSAAEAAANANATLAAITAQVTGTPPAATAPPETADPTVDALNQSADASIAQANAIIAAAQAQAQQQ